MINFGLKLRAVGFVPLGFYVWRNIEGWETYTHYFSFPIMPTIARLVYLRGKCK